MLKKITTLLLVLLCLFVLSVNFSRNNFLESIKHKYSFIEKYSITLGSSNNRSLFIDYYINSNIYNNEIEQCFEDTKNYAISYKTNNKKASNIREIYIRFIDHSNNYKEYSSYYYALGNTVYTENENLNKIDNFNTWIVYYEND
jgi:hypothetical protein